MKVLRNKAVFDRVVAGEAPSAILESLNPELEEFRKRRAEFEIYE
jgi:hypothetical protein